MAKFGGRNGLAFCRPVHLLKSGHISGIDTRNVSREYLGPFGIPQWTLTAAFRCQCDSGSTERESGHSPYSFIFSQEL